MSAAHDGNAARHARRLAAKAARLASDDSSSETDDDYPPKASVLTINSFPDTQKHQVLSIGREWNTFIVDHRAHNDPPVFPPHVVQVEDLLNTKDPLPSYETLVAFERFHALGSTPRHNSQTAITEGAVHQRWYLTRKHIIISTERHLPDDITRSVTKWIRQDLKAEINFRDIDPAIPWMRFCDIAALCEGYFSSPPGTSSDLQNGLHRWNNIAYCGLLTKESARGAAFVKGSTAFLDQLDVVFGDLILHVVADTANPPGPNKFVLDVTTPNGKTRESKHIEASYPSSDLGLWTDVPFLILVIAHLRDAFPQGWTMAQLLDPAEFISRPGIKSFEVAFHPDRKDEPVFIRDYRYTRSPDRRPLPCDGTWFRNEMKKASLAAGIHPKATPQLLRRSGPIEMRLAGYSIEDVVEHLRHKWGSDAQERYVKRATAIDISARVHDQQPDLDELNLVHPDRVRRYPPSLSVTARHSVMLAEDMIHAMLKYDDLRKDRLQEYQVRTISMLPEDVQSELLESYTPIRKEFNRRLQLKRDELAQQAGRITDRLGANPGTLIDEVPAGEDIDCNIVAAVEYLVTHDFSSVDESLVNAANAGTISNDDFATAMHTFGAPMSGDEQLGSVLDNLSNGDENDIQAFSSTEAALNVDSNDQSQGSTRSNTAFDAVADGSIMEESTGLSPYRPVIEVLFHSTTTDVDRVKAFDICVGVQLDESVTFGYRPDHSPLDNHCRFCNEYLKVHPSNPTFAQTKTCRNRNQKHVNLCGAKTCRSTHISTLLNRYPSSILFCPLTNTKPSKSVAKGVEGLDLTNLAWPVLYLHRRFDLRLDAHRKRFNELPRCALCYEGNGTTVRFKSSEQVCEHVLMVHGIYCPDRIARFDECKPCLQVPWNEETANFPLPHFWTHDMQYHWDPADTALVAGKVLEQRIAQAAAAVKKPYGLHPALLAPETHWDPLCANGQPYDSKYLGITGKRGLTVRDPLCLLCINNTERSITGRGITVHRRHPTKEAVRDQDNFHTHCTICLRDHLQRFRTLEIYASEGLTPTIWDEHPWWSNGQIVCPDPACFRFNKRFPSKLAWVNHCVGVHLFQWRGKAIETLNVPRPLSDFTFPDEEALDLWMATVGKEGSAVKDAMVEAGIDDDESLRQLSDEQGKSQSSLESRLASVHKSPKNSSRDDEQAPARSVKRRRVGLDREQIIKSWHARNEQYQASHAALEKKLKQASEKASKKA
ncbi:hypothetical protein I317_03013 [Kwoniella heveanensis CBS 569]|nr:hypothetical protein I317_03013 [Kwoniella heveanensis CBS 569]